MSGLYMMLAVISAGLAAAVFWRALKPPKTYEIESERRGHRAEIRAGLFKNKAWYPYLLDILWVLSYLVRGERLKGARASLDEKLRKAGDMFGLEASEFLGLCILSSATLALTLSWAMSQVTLGWVAPTMIIGAGMGYVLPLLYLEDLVSRRMRAIHIELPYVLDTVGISLSAGLTFQQSMERLLRKAEKRESVLLEELKIVHMQMEMGVSLENAFAELKDRVPSNFVADVANAVRQSVRLGAPLQQVFRVQSDAIRLKRTHRAERKAAEAPVKMLLPLSFIFIGILIIIVGPSVIQVIHGGMF